MRWLKQLLHQGTHPIGERQVDRSGWIADDAWSGLLGRHAFLARLSPDQRARLRHLCGAFLADKSINGAGGLELTDVMIGSIAVQACLPILELGLDAYPAFSEIIVYPSDFIVDREIVDENGVVHAWTEAIAGESWDGGPIVLAWDAASGENSGRAHRPAPAPFNVVIHEFAHKLDMANGVVDGTPLFIRRLHPGLDEGAWQDVLAASLHDFAARVDAVEAAIPRHIDPESARADRHYASLPFDAYAETDEAEFFSVATEAFFIAPTRLQAAYPRLYELFVAYYRQDPRVANS